MTSTLRFASLQEEVVFKLSEATFGEAMLFQPHLYANGKEPADIAWVTNRCAVLMYMTESKKSFLKKRDHNIKQMIQWLKKWKGGALLKGTVKTGQGRPYVSPGTKDVEFQFSDIDHVIGLSVVEGGEVFCQYHERLCVDYSDLKLSACGTVAGSTVRLLAETLANPRTLLHWLRELRAISGELPVAAEQFATEIRNRLQGDIIAQRNQFPKTTGVHSARDTEHILHALGFLKHLAETAATITDLQFSDFVWLSLATANVGALVGYEQLGRLRHAELTTDSDIYMHRCISYIDSSAMVDDMNLSNARRGQKPGIDIVSMFDAGPEAPPLQFILNHRRRHEPSMMQAELDVLRQQAALQRSHETKIIDEMHPNLDKSGVRFTITTPAGSSTVLDASVNASGSIIVKPRIAKFKRPDHRVNFADRMIIEAHCTIHPSHRSPDGNLIHFTTRHDEGPPFEMHLFTHAIKKTRRFAPLFIARVANPIWNRRTEEPLKPGTRSVALGLLRPDAFSLFYFVLVGPKDRLFVRSDMNLDTNVKQEIIGDVSLVFLWSFLCHPSHNTGETVHFGSTKEPNGLEPEALNLMRLLQHGITDYQVMLHWVAGRDLMVDNLREMLKHEHAGFPQNLAFLEWLRFFELGVLTDQHHRYLMRFARNRSLPTELIKVPESHRQFERPFLFVPRSTSLRDRLRQWRGARAHLNMRWQPRFTDKFEEMDVSTRILP